MTWKQKYRLVLSLFTLFYLIGLYLFYIKYVPFVKLFQIILISILFLLTLTTIIKVKWGILIFIFFIPLINNLPYFFGIFEHTPHAPTALVLFLFFFLGWLIHSIIFPSKLSFNYPIFKPIILFSILILISAIITFLRYANFYPFLSDYIYELITNVNGVTAGGAIMSIIFNSLNYLTGFAFFFILLNSVKSKEFIKRILIVLLVSTFISVIFGFYQHFKDMSFGNTPLRVTQRIINSTFKDPLSFGGYIAIFAPLMLGVFFAFKGLIRIFATLSFFSVLFIFPHTGSRSGLLGVIISLLIFLILFIKININPKKPISLKKIIIFVMVFSLVIIIIFSIFILSKESILYKRLNILKLKYKSGGLEKALGIRWSNRWKMATYMMKDYPFTGVGIGAYIIELPNYSRINKLPYKKTDSVENYFLQVGSEMGLLALFFSLWIFWEIIRQIKKSLSKYLLPNNWKYVQIGVSCGIISIFVIFFVHTYIGSYEIKYIFWLMVALIFCLSKGQKELKKKFNFGKNFKFFTIALTIVFSTIHLWNSTHSLSLKSRTEQLNLKQVFGLSKIEKTIDGKKFRWTKHYGGLIVKVKKPIIEIPLLASHPDIDRKPVRVKVYLIKDFFREKNLLDEIILRENKWQKYNYYIPEILNEEVILLFKVNRTWNPLKVLGTPDPRNLGVAVGEINFRDEIGEEGIGFYEDKKEGEYRRTRKKAILEYRVENEKIIIPVLASHPDIREKPLILKIKINGREIKSIKIKDNNWHNYEVKIPKEYIGKKILLGFEVDRTWCPFEYKIANDKRDLGVCIGKIENGN